MRDRGPRDVVYSFEPVPRDAAWFPDLAPGTPVVQVPSPIIGSGKRWTNWPHIAHAETGQRYGSVARASLRRIEG